MSDNHLSNEVSVSAELTPTGVKAGAKSRFISAIDLFFGNAVDLLNPKLEGIRLRERARNAQDVKLIEAAGERRVQMLDNDPAYADLVMQQQLRTAARRIENKAATVRLAIEDLRTNPPTEEQNQAGPAELDPDILNRIERYAEDAGSDKLREKWGRVLAGEIRAPGTFSGKVMRVVDELEPDTAMLFERVCRARIGMTLMGCLVGDLEYLEVSRLIAADLLVDPGSTGQIRQPTRITLSTGEPVHMFGLHNVAITFDVDAEFPEAQAYGREMIKEALTMEKDSPAIPVYILTDVGHAISSIINHDETAVAHRYIQVLSGRFPSLPFTEFRKNEAGAYVAVKMWNPATGPAHSTA